MRFSSHKFVSDVWVDCRCVSGERARSGYVTSPHFIHNNGAIPWRNTFRNMIIHESWRCVCFAGPVVKPPTNVPNPIPPTVPVPPIPPKPVPAPPQPNPPPPTQPTPTPPPPTQPPPTPPPPTQPPPTPPPPTPPPPTQPPPTPPPPTTTTVRALLPCEEKQTPSNVWYRTIGYYNYVIDRSTGNIATDPDGFPLVVANPGQPTETVYPLRPKTTTGSFCLSLFKHKRAVRHTQTSIWLFACHANALATCTIKVRGHCAAQVSELRAAGVRQR